MTTQQEVVKHVIDGASVVTAFAAFMNMLPAIAALFSIIWTGMRIIEMITGKPFSELIKKKEDKNG
jgi:hypothetical protein